MKIGILRESKIPADNRVPLTPEQCRQFESKIKGVNVVVQPSEVRCFTNEEYKQAGITVQQDLSDCDVLLGVKEVKQDYLIPGKIYLFFSHIIKKQPYNRELLKTILKKQIHLIDYETLADSNGIRIIGFGRWAGLAGTYNGIRAFCLRNRINDLPPAHRCKNLAEMKLMASSVKLPPLKIVVTGGGRVAGGSEEMLGAFGIKKVTVEEFLLNENYKFPVYTQLDPEYYNAGKNGRDFDLSHFFKNPEDYTGTFSRFCNITDLLIMAAYWDPRAPALFTIDEMRKNDFRIRVIADITCDINGSVPSSVRTTTHEEPYFDFNPVMAKEEEAFSDPSNITIMTIDNLPVALPKEASADFGNRLMQKVLPLLINGDQNSIIKRATIAKDGKLTTRYSYLSDWIKD